MSWTLKKDTLYNKSSNEIAYFLPTASEHEKLMIKNGDELIDLIGEFMIGYDEGKKQVSKKLFEKFKKNIDSKANYKIDWKVTIEGELVNENHQVVCIFTAPDSIYPKLINHFPIIYDAVQDLVNDLSSSKGLALKKIYDKICEFYDRTI
ncbi:MAG: hypothetical protein KA319_06305 [Ferruginibacter sp.]|nr:hypothetical protein [Ferruginibacter sp.]